jgi:PhnB protein
MAIHEMFTYVCVKDAGKAIEFYKKAFGATEKFRLPSRAAGSAMRNCCSASRRSCCRTSSPRWAFMHRIPDGPRTFVIHLHVDSADDAISRPSAQVRAWGGRPGPILRRMIRHGARPFGYVWMLGHSIEQMEPAEMQRRYDDLVKKSSP